MTKFLDKSGFAHAWQNIKNYVDNKVDSSSGGAQSENIPPGFIGIWSGSAVPDGWALCDGTNGTPDLRDKFVLGAGTHSVGETGGSEEVTLTEAQMPKHNHVEVSGNFSLTTISGTSSKHRHILNTAYESGASDVYNEKTRDTGSSKPHPNMPPYYVLAYIMKL